MKIIASFCVLNLTYLFIKIITKTHIQECSREIAYNLLTREYTIINKTPSYTLGGKI